MPCPKLKTYHCEVFRAKRHTAVIFWSRIKSKNRKILWTSETYTTKQNAVLPVLKLIKYLGKKRCSLTFIDQIKNKTKEILC